jgi:hypothetical protein
METRAKKAKLRSMNPFEKVCSDVHDFIFQHLDKEDILKLSEVSAASDSAISTSSICMSKVPLKFGHLHKRTDARKIKVMMRSQRRYQNLNITIAVNETKENARKMIKLMKKFSLWLKELKIGVNANDVEVPQDLILPRLETLEINVPRKLFFASATRIKKLILYYQIFNRECVDWIQSQKRLEELEVNESDNFFDFDPVAPKGLKSFEFWLSDLNDAEKMNKFLQPVCDSLTFLSLYQCRAENLEMIVNEMPKLETFIFSELLGNIGGLKLNANENIVELTLITLIEPQIYKLLLSFVGLEILEVFALSSIEDFAWVARNMKKLKKFRFYWEEPTVDEIDERYEEMIAMDENVNKNIEIICKWT